MKKIVFCGLLHDRNLGDPLIMDALKHLYREALGDAAEYELTSADLYGRTSPSSLWGERKLNAWDRLVHYSLAALRKLITRMDRPFGRRIAYESWRLNPNGLARSVRYFTERFRGASLVVVAGGALIEYSVHEHHIPLKALVDTAAALGVPVVVNAVGLVEEAGDAGDWRFRMIRDALRSPEVKRVSFRDNVGAMIEKYLGPGSPAVIVADPGVWIAEALGAERREDAGLIGLGLIRSGIFNDYGSCVREEDLISLWAGITKELDRRNHRWVFFCNGFEKDYDLGLKILSRLDVADSGSRLVARPTDYRELVETVGSFRAVICHRLHACVIAYSLNIPAVALSWNSKLEHFMDAVGCPERVFDPRGADAGRIVGAMERAIAEGYDQERRARYRQTAADSVRDAVRLLD